MLASYFFYFVAVSDTDPVSIHKEKIQKIGFITNKNFQILKDRKLFCVRGMNNFLSQIKSKDIHSCIKTKIVCRVRNVGFIIFLFDIYRIFAVLI